MDNFIIKNIVKNTYLYNFYWEDSEVDQYF